MKATASLSLAILLAAATANAAVSTNADGTWSELTMPGAMIDQVAIYDPFGDRMIVFGGIAETRSGSTNLTWSWSRSTSPPWSVLDAVDTNDPITGLYDATALLDLVRHRMLVFGGKDGALRNDVWALDLAPNAKWTRLLPQGTAPSPREGAALVYDSARDRMLLFGGNGAGWNSELWTLSLSGTPTWTQLAALGTPPPAARSAAVYDAPDDRLVIYNGTTVWQAAFAASATQPTWTQLATTGTPPSRANFSAVYDSAGRQLVVHGGSNGTGGVFAETWALSLSPALSWSQLPPAGTSPTGRFFHSAVFDADRREMLLYGGFNYVNLVQTWLAGPSSLALGGIPVWHAYGGDYSPPRAEGLDAGVYDSRRDRFLVAGAFAGTPATSWSSHRALNLNSPSGWDDAPDSVADRAAAIYDPRFDGVVTFGGQDTHLGVTRGGPSATSFTGQPGWSGTSGPSPGTSATRQAIYDPVRYRMVLFGGDAHASGHSVWAIGLASPHLCEPIAPQGTPPSDRDPDVVVYDPVRDRMIVFGGWANGPGTWFNDTWALNLSGPLVWTPLAATGAPPSGHHYFGVYDPVRDRLVVYAASGAWALPLADASAWTPLSPAGTAPGRDTSEIVAAYDPVRDRMLLQLTPLSAVANPQPYSTTWTLDWGQPARPVALCAPEDTARIVSLVLSASFNVVNVLDGARAIGWRFESDRAWPGLPVYGTTIVGGHETQAIVVHAPVPDSAATGDSELHFTAWYEGGEGFDAACSQMLAIDATTATLPAFESMLVEPDLVTLRWDLAQDAASGATIHRRDDAAAAWQTLGPATIESGRYAVYRDATVEPGAVYWYRAGIPTPSGERLLAPVRVAVPAAFALAIESPSPNPARELRVAFTLPNSRAATLEVFDVGGRRVARRQLAGRAAGRQELELGRGLLPAGLYLVRLQQGERSVSTRAVILE